MKFQNILVPYNGSAGAKKEFFVALELASNTNENHFFKDLRSICILNYFSYIVKFYWLS
jgi:hypothetical protein